MPSRTAVPPPLLDETVAPVSIGKAGQNAFMLARVVAQRHAHFAGAKAPAAPPSKNAKGPHNEPEPPEDESVSLLEKLPLIGNQWTGKWLKRHLQKYENTPLLGYGVRALNNYDEQNRYKARLRFDNARQSGPQSREERENPLYLSWGFLLKSGVGVLHAGGGVADLVSVFPRLAELAAVAASEVTGGVSLAALPELETIAKIAEGVSAALGVAEAQIEANHLDYRAVVNQDDHSKNADKEAASIRADMQRNTSERRLSLVHAAGLAVPALVKILNVRRHLETLHLIPAFVPRAEKWMEQIDILLNRSKGTQWTGMFAPAQKWVVGVGRVVKLGKDAWKIIKPIAAILSGAGTVASAGAAYAWGMGKWAAKTAYHGLQTGAGMVKKGAKAVWSGMTWLGHKAVDGIGGAADKIGQTRGGQAFGEWVMRNKEWIGPTLKTSSEVLGLAGAATGVVAAGFALTGVGVPLGVPLGAISLALTAGGIAAGSWYSTMLALGTLDNTATLDETNQQMWKSVKDLALFGAVSLFTKMGDAGELAEKYAGTDAVGNKAVQTVNGINAWTEKINAFLGLNFKPIMQNAQLAARLGWLVGLQKSAEFIKSGVEFATDELLHKLVEMGVSVVKTGGRAVYRGATKAVQGIKRGVASVWHSALDFAGGIAAKTDAFFHGKYPHDGELTGPFYPTHPSKGQHHGQGAEVAEGLIKSRQAALWVNGVQTDFPAHCQAAQELANALHQPVVGIYNATGGAVRDTAQYFLDKFGFGDRAARNPAIETLMRLIEKHGDPKDGQKGGLQIYAHSHGTVIVGEALRRLRAEGQNLSDVEFTGFGPAIYSVVPGLRGAHMFAFDDDVIATLLGPSGPGGAIAKRFAGMGGVLPASGATTVLHHGGAGIRPHGVMQDTEKGTNHRDGQMSYIDALPQFRQQEKNNRAFDAAHPVWGAMRQNTLASRSTLATGWAMARGLGQGAADLIGSGYNQMDGFLHHVLPPGSDPALQWSGLDFLLRHLGSGAQAMGAGAGHMMDAALGGKVQAPKPGSGRGGLQRSGASGAADFALSSHLDPALLRAALVGAEGHGFAAPSSVRDSLAPSLGFDPSQARLHRGAASAQAARALDADAFTIGRDVFFGTGKYHPHTPQGQGLLAHELTHVGQQTSGQIHGFSASGGDAMEQEAQRVGQMVESGGLSLPQPPQIGSYSVQYDVQDYDVSPADRTRLGTISQAALREARQRLMFKGLPDAEVDTVEVSVEIDLGVMTDGEAVETWANAIVQAVVFGVPKRSASAKPLGMQRAPISPEQALAHAQSDIKNLMGGKFVENLGVGMAAGGAAGAVMGGSVSFGAMALPGWAVGAGVGVIGALIKSGGFMNVLRFGMNRVADVPGLFEYAMQRSTNRCAAMSYPFGLQRTPNQSSDENSSGRDLLAALMLSVSIAHGGENACVPPEPEGRYAAYDVSSSVAPKPAEKPKTSPVPPAAPDDPANLMVSSGQITFDAEGNDAEKNRYFSRIPHWPGGGSGVTIGRGYDLGQKKKKQVEQELKAAGLDAEAITVLLGAVGLRGEKAHTWVKEHKAAFKPITRLAQKNLFNEIKNEYKDRADHQTKANGIDLTTRHHAIQDLVFDMVYRGSDYKNHHTKLDPLIKANDLVGLHDLLAKKVVSGTGKAKKITYTEFPSVPPDRQERRIALLSKAIGQKNKEK